MSEIAPITVNVDGLIALNKYEVDEDHAHIELVDAPRYRGIQETRTAVSGGAL